jgi:hypothetical protein
VKACGRHGLFAHWCEQMAKLDLLARDHVLAFGEDDFCAITKRQIKR